jgi:hypothetical protein
MPACFRSEIGSYLRNLVHGETGQLSFPAGVQAHMGNNFTKSLLVLAAGVLFVGISAAQTTTSTSGAGPGVYDPGHPRVNEVNGREEAQQQRIANGVKNGSLSPGETANLEKRENHIQNEEKRDMAKHDGHLTQAEQNRINRQQNHVSRSIYKDKHN